MVWAEMSDRQADTIASVIVWGSFALGATVTVWFLCRSLLPLRLEKSDPWQFARPCRNFSIRTFSGLVSDAAKAMSNQVTGITGTAVHTRTNTRNEFTLDDLHGTVIAVQAFNFDAMVSVGHAVSVGWVVWKKGNGGPYVFILNHTTGLIYKSGDDVIRDVQFGNPPKGKQFLRATGWFLGIVGEVILLPVLIVARIIHGGRRRAFMRHGLEPLERVLHEKAAPLLRVAARASAPSMPTFTSLVAPPPPEGAPAGWFADPHGRHERRWWDGARWTDHVSSGGAAAVDPV
jgi:hypothetical protein